MKKISDRLCEEYNLSVIRNPKGKSKHYAEWLAEKKGYPTIRGQIRDELDEIIKCSYTMNEFWRILKERGFEICRRKPQYAYTSFIPPYGTKQVKLDKLGPDYTEEAIAERIRTVRNGIRLDKPSPDYNAWLKKYEPIKLKGFKALYYHYLYLFGKIRKKETRQRVSFYLREELTKFERYQKQFHFLYENDIESSGQLNEMKKITEDKIAELITERSRLYHKTDSKEEIADMNKELKELRATVRMCNNILQDSERINEHHNKALELEKQAEVKQITNKKSMEMER